MFKSYPPTEPKVITECEWHPQFWEDDCPECDAAVDQHLDSMEDHWRDGA